MEFPELMVEVFNFVGNTILLLLELFLYAELTSFNPLLESPLFLAQI